MSVLCYRPTTASFLGAFCWFVFAFLTPDGNAGDEVTAWQVRSGDEMELNEAIGWAAPIDTPATVTVDSAFRIRFEIERSLPGPARYRLEMRRNGSDWQPVQALDHPYPEEIASPVSSIVKARSYDHGEATEDLIAHSARVFAGGSGISLRPSPLLVSFEAGQTEWEWPLVIRYFSDGALRVDRGDLFEYRMTSWDGTPLSGHPAQVTVSVPDGHLGGTYVETPDRIGPFEAANGDLYFIQEPSETDNVFMVVKSEDGGRSWFEADGAHRPVQADLEAVSAILLDDTLHIVHQADEVWYHQFVTATHPETPDRWSVRDELVHGDVDPLTQAITLSARPDGSLVTVFAGDQALLSRTRRADGQWSDAIQIEGSPGRILSGPVSAAAGDGSVHLAYVDDQGEGWYRTMRLDGSLTEAERIATDLGRSETERLAILPLNRLASGQLSLIYRREDGLLHERRRDLDGSWGAPVVVTQAPVTSGPVDSDQVTADAVTIGNAVHVLYIDAQYQSLWHVARPAGADSWGEPALIVDGIEGQWVRGSVTTNGGGGLRYAYVVDTGSHGGSGMNLFAFIALPDSVPD